MFLGISLFLSLVYLVLINAVARGARTLWPTCITAICVTTLGWCLVILVPAVVLMGFLTALAAAACACLKRGPRAFLYCSVGALVLSHVLIGLMMLHRARTFEDLSERYPVESMATRLGQAKRLPRRSDRTRQLELENDLKIVEMQMDRLDNTREAALGALHDSTVTDFVNSAGFGVSRGIQPSRSRIELPEAESIPFLDAPPVRKSYPSWPGDPAANPVNNTRPEEWVLSTMNLHSIVDFANPKGFGWVQDRNHVRGFQSHHFHERPSVEAKSGQQQPWLVQKVELVSLLMHDQPVVYASQYLPRMQDLRGGATRPLNAFEAASLAALEAGGDV